MQIRRRLGIVLPAFLLGAVAFGNGRPPADSNPAWVQVAGGRVYWRALPAARGGFYVVWSASTTTGPELFAQAFATDGSPVWSMPGIEISRKLSGSGLWDVCSDGRGGFIVGGVESGRLAARQILPNGTIGWTEASAPVGEAPNALVAIDDGQKGAFFTWSQEAAPNSQIWLQRLGAQGKTLWPLPGVLPAPSDARQTQPNIVPDGEGGVIVGWKSFQEQVSKVRVQRLRGDGARLWTDRGTDVESPAGDLHQRILMVPAGAGGVVLAWTDTVEGKSRLFFQQVGPDGRRRWSPAGRTPQAPVFEQWNPVLLSNGEKGIWLGWEEIDEAGVQKLRFERRDMPDGNLWTAGKIALADSPGSQGRLDMVRDGSGGVAAAWIDNRTNVGLYLQRVDAEGRLLLGSKGLTVATDLKKPQRPQLVMLTGNRVAVVWLEEIKDGVWAFKRRVIDLLLK